MATRFFRRRHTRHFCLLCTHAKTTEPAKIVCVAAAAVGVKIFCLSAVAAPNTLKLLTIHILSLPPYVLVPPS